MQYDINALKVKMLVKYPFFGSVISNVEYVEDESVKTACTDGKKIYYNSQFLSDLKTEEQVFILAHEVCHIAFNHILRSEGKIASLWNYATDAVINQYLKRDGLKMIEGGIDYADAINYDAEQLYEKLLKEQQQKQQGNQDSQQQGQNGQNNQQQGQNNQGEAQKENDQNGDKKQQSNKNEQQGQNGENEQKEQNGQGEDQKENSEQQQEQNGQGEDQKENSEQQQEQNGQGEDQNENDMNNSSPSLEEKSAEEKEKDNNMGHDSHSMWEEAVKKYHEEQDKKDDEEKQNQEEKDSKDAESVSEKDMFEKNKEEKKKLLEGMKKEMNKKASQAGKEAGGMKRDISDIGKSKPVIDWRYVLREAIKFDMDWSYQHATIENGIVCAQLEEQPLSDTEIVLDTSGSIDDGLLRAFLRECKNILKSSRVHVGCFDTKFYGFNEIRSEQDIENMTFEGGGGTNFDVAVDAFTNRVENKIIFTDGASDMPDKPVNAIWIVFGGKKINPPGGRVIYIDENQLRKLLSLETDKDFTI